jgi:hypothetical protein
MATITTNEAETILAGVKALAQDYAAKGLMILANEAQAPTAFGNLVDKSEAESAALLAGSIVLSAAGGDAFLVVPQMEGAWTAPAGAASGLRVLHSTMHGHCLPATQLRAFHGYLPGPAARKGATFTVNSSPATATFEQDPANLAVTRVHLSAPAVWAAPHICPVEEFAQLTGQTFQPMAMQVTRTGVDGGRAADLLRTAEAQRVMIPEGTLAELFSTVMQAAGQDMLPGTRRETTAGDLCAFAASLLGLLPTRELGVAVGRAEMAAAGNRVTDYGEQTLAKLTPTLQAAMDRLATRLGSQWDLVTQATVRALAYMPAAARQHPALEAGAMLREQLLLDIWFERARCPSAFVPVLPPSVSGAAVEPATPPHSDPGDDPGWPELRG